MKKWLLLLLCTMLAIALTACGGVVSAEPKQESAGLAAGEDFSMGDETYALEKWVLLPEYNTDTHAGYGVCFVQKEGIAPILISGSSYRSLIDMTLDTGGEAISTRNISFIKVEDAPGYAARVTFEFSLPKDAKLPAIGRIFHSGKDEEADIDLSTLGAPLPASEPAVTEAPVPEEPPLDAKAQAYCGDWLLEAIVFCTPNADNGIFAIEGTMEVSEGFEFGRELTLNEDMTMNGLVNLDGLVDAVTELPFAISGLDLNAYTNWAYEDGMVTFMPDGPALAAEYDEAAGELRLKRGGEVEIKSVQTGDAVSKSGMVDMDITMIFQAV